MKHDINDLFFQTIRVAIGTADCLSRIPTAEERGALFQLAKKQSLLGICFLGLQKHRESIGDVDIRKSIRDKQFLQWMGVVSTIQRLNEHLNELTEKALKYFREKGFPCYVLKGQGIASLYGDLASLRQSGDVDVWLNCTRKQLYELSLAEFGKVEGITYHHIHYDLFKDVEVEAHIYPSFLSSPFCNKALKDFCELYKPTPEGGDTPNLAFNRVFILLHCYRHVCGHGIGLRQFLDYYFVLKQGLIEEEERKETLLWIERLGMKRFAEASMWVMKEVFGLSDEYLLCGVSEANGRFLLAEIIRCGNEAFLAEGYLTHKSALERYWYNLKRDIRLMRMCPHESFWDPMFNIYQFVMSNFVWNKIAK